MIVLGDFNAKVGYERYEDTEGSYGVGEINERGQRLIDLCEKDDLFYL